MQDRLINPEKKIQHFEKVLSVKEEKMNQVLELASSKLKNFSLESDCIESGKIERKLKKNGFVLLHFYFDTLTVWSDKSIQISNLYSQSKLNKPIVFLGNAWYKTVNLEDGDGHHLTGLILLKHKYVYENKFLHSGFQKKFRIPACVELLPNPVEGGKVVLDDNGEFLFSLLFNKQPTCLNADFHWPAYLYFVGILMALLLIRLLFKILRKKISPNLLLPLLVLLLIGMNFMIFYLKIPAQLFNLELFSPYYFAFSSRFSSIGHLLVSSLFIFLISYIFYKDFNLRQVVKNKEKYGDLFNSAALISGALFFVITVYLFKNLILNSNVSFEPYKIIRISYLSLTGYFAIVLLFISLGLYLFKVINEIKKQGLGRPFIIPFAAVLVFFIFIHFLVYSQLDLFSIGFFFLLVLAIYRLVPGLPYASLVIFSILFGLYSTFIVIDNSEKKELNTRKVLALNLSSDTDPVAEHLLDKPGRELLQDEGLKTLMKVSDFTDRDVQKIYNYLQYKYFDGFWEKFDLNITLCNSNSSLLIDGTTEEHCFTFFENMVDDESLSPLGNGFYFMGTQSGKSSFFGSFLFPDEDDEPQNGLFIRLDSKLIYQQLGYPELLLDNSLYRPSVLDEYSHAKYKNGKLTVQVGKFKYSLSDKVFQDSNEEFSVTYNAGYNHLVYRMPDDSMVVVSQKQITPINLLISFSYLFVFLFLVSNLIYLLASLPYFDFKQPPLLKYKIQLWMISFLFVSLILIGAGIIYFSINQYRDNQYLNLSEKIQSVYIELDHKLGLEPQISKNWSSDQYASLDELLIKFSNVFYSDINLYDIEGNLLATSRPEIFSNGLSGYKMDYTAYRELVIRKQAEYVHEEIIGDQVFLSAYLPFTNQDKQLLAYLNLPYFTKQNTITREITNLVVGIVNFSMVLILISIILAVIISNQITNPLGLIQKKIGEVKLGKKNEPIYYKGQDEIGSLISEYNRMIDELAESAGALAKSERESAWREMARQIAHEIKNPLTPMKLSIQHLQRSWKDKSPDWEAQLEKISQTVVEQIDHLSSIASAFSNFAEMPGTKNSNVDIISVIRNTVSLFSNNKRIRFNLDLHKHETALVYADESQLIRVFNNLVKNAIQSIPENSDGMIRIELEVEAGMVVVSIEDNGQGIPDELEDKLFEPNFTTKSSGMGLGLAIVKKIIEDAKGNIRYDTKLGEGTTFIIELPEQKR